MAILEKIGSLILGIAGVCLFVYLRYLSMVNTEERREHKSGLQGLFKKLD